MRKNIIFDFDGIIADSVLLHFNAWKKTFLKHGIDLSFDDYKTQLNGISRLQGVRNVLPDANEDLVAQIAEEKQRLLIQDISNTPPILIDGILEVLESFLKNDVTISVASSSKNAGRLLEVLNIYDRFETVVTGYDFENPKPEPDIFLTAAKKINAAAKDCCVIEDAAAGVIAAKRAGMKSVGVASSEARENFDGADIVVDRVKDINVNEVLNLF